MKELNFEANSLGEVITRLRYSDNLTMLDFHRACRVHVTIDTESPLDPTYLHIGGPVPIPNDKDTEQPNPNGTERTKTRKRRTGIIGFLRNRTEE